MKKLVFAFVMALCLSAPHLSFAFDTPVESERGRAILQKMGNDMASIGKGFNCPDYAWANFVDGGRVAAFVYVPAGSDYKKSPRKVSVAIHALEGEPAKDKVALNELAKNLQAGYQKNAKVIRMENFHNAKDEPAFFIEYTIGEGAAKEHNAGAFMRLTSHTAAFVQLQSRGTALVKSDVEKVRALIAPPAGAAPAQKKG